MENGLTSGSRGLLAGVEMNRPVRAHLIGVGGSGMRSLAALLLESGWTLTGSDATRVTSLPFDPRSHHAAENIPPETELIIYSTAIPSNNIERMEAARRGILAVDYPQMLAALSQANQTIAIAGTHGKSTTTAMLTEMLTTEESHPMSIYGATLVDQQSEKSMKHSGFFNSGTFIVEACEYQRNFLQLSPRMAVILNVEQDHFDYFKDEADYQVAFREFAAKVDPDGFLLVSADDSQAMAAAAGAACHVETFGFAPNATWRAVSVRHRPGGYHAKIMRNGRQVAELWPNLAGKYNLSNALAAVVLAHQSGASWHRIEHCIRHFPGLQRRLQYIGELAGVRFFDDFAHHPSEIAANLATLREENPMSRICCVFQPHQASRTRRLLDSFARSLENTDMLAVCGVFLARETPMIGDENLSTELLERVSSGCKKITALTDTDILDIVQHELSPGDVVVTMGAGDVGKLNYELIRRVRAVRQAG